MMLEGQVCGSVANVSG